MPREDRGGQGQRQVGRFGDRETGWPQPRGAPALKPSAHQRLDPVPQLGDRPKQRVALGGNGLHRGNAGPRTGRQLLAGHLGAARCQRTLPTIAGRRRRRGADGLRQGGGASGRTAARTVRRSKRWTCRPWCSTRRSRSCAGRRRRATSRPPPRSNGSGCWPRCRGAGGRGNGLTPRPRCASWTTRTRAGTRSRSASAASWPCAPCSRRRGRWKAAPASTVWRKGTAPTASRCGGSSCANCAWPPRRR